MVKVTLSRSVLKKSLTNAYMNDYYVSDNLLGAKLDIFEFIL